MRFALADIKNLPRVGFSGPWARLSVDDKPQGLVWTFRQHAGEVMGPVYGDQHHFKLFTYSLNHALLLRPRSAVFEARSLRSRYCRIVLFS